MDRVRRIASDDELHAIAAAGAGFIIDPFNRRWHLAGCPHIAKMTTGQPKWFARSPAIPDQYLEGRLAHYATARPIVACPTCGHAAPALPASTEVPAGGHPASDRSGPAAVTAALGEIVTEHGPAVLSRPAQLANLLKDLLPDTPAVTRMLVAAAEEHIPGQLHDHAAAGLDDVTAARLAAASLASRTLYDPDTCLWLVSAIAAALGPSTGYTPTVPAAPAEPAPLAEHQHPARTGHRTRRPR